MQAYGPAVLRLGLGAVFVAHGAQKLLGVWGGLGLAGTAQSLANLHFPAVMPLAVLVAVVELAGGIMLILGALTRYVALALAIEMAVALWEVHLPNGFFINWGLEPGIGHGYEFNMTLIAALISMTLTGPGAFSIDAWRARSAEAEAYGRARLRAGKV
ncbi:MAG: hypothetical protein A3H96_25975 [Acidobacteria bacterium RIFCSPLOWO2_02_FULL_67_36]|nr:MAG: hypothetical protein A3H96_25975 [Acidobacteria bacterium RIFCSPLOWO2_02_FULL_67_36]OFW22965.1 MAG: hypothetical protein A3G21_01490 [Acidobacteria bacterium RIFCSPLOWO2_12_FULL_66_21]